jgi:hypothetical protein
VRLTKTVAKVSERLGLRSYEIPNACPAQQEQVAHPVAHKLSEEKHYTPAELAAMWHLSPATIRKLVRNEPGVLKLQGDGSAHGKRSYTTFSIPESVALRVHERLAQQPLQTQLPRRDPRRVVFLRNRHRRVA